MLNFCQTGAGQVFVCIGHGRNVELFYSGRQVEFEFKRQEPLYMEESFLIESSNSRYRSSYQSEKGGSGMRHFALVMGVLLLLLFATNGYCSGEDAAQKVTEQATEEGKAEVKEASEAQEQAKDTAEATKEKTEETAKEEAK